MKVSIRPAFGRELLAFLLPSAAILSQWFSVAGINISWLLYILLFLLVFLRHRMLFSNGGLLVFVAAVVGLPPLTYVFGIAPSFSVGLYFSQITGMVVMLFICLMDDVEDKAFMRGVLFSCILFTAWGIYEVLTGHYVLFSNDAFFRYNWVGMHYPGVAFANTNDLVQYLVLLYPISGYLLLKRAKWLFASLAVAVVFVAFQAGSKLGMIAVVVTLMFAYAIGMITSGKKERNIRMFLLGVGILLALLTFDAFTGVVSAVVDNFFVIDTSADYYTGRDDIYTPLLGFALTHPMGGFGSAYVATEMAPHNLLLYVLCDYGWIPCGVVVVVVFKMAWFVLKKARESEGDAFWCLMLAALCLFVLTSSISSCNEQRKAVWIFLGICVRNVYLAPYGGGEGLRSKWLRLGWGRG